MAENIVEIGEMAFLDTRWLDNCDKEAVIAGSVLYKYTGSGDEYTIPDSVTVIDQHGFFGCINLREVSLPDNGIKIAENAFNDCGFFRINYISRICNGCSERGFV